MKKYYSLIEPKKLLHIVYKKEEFKKIKDSNRLDIVDEKQFLQLSALKLDKKDIQAPLPHLETW